MYGGMPSGLGKPNPMTSTTGDISSAGSYKHQGYDTAKTGSNYSAYSVPQGGYGFIPTGVCGLVGVVYSCDYDHSSLLQPVPLQMPPNYIPGHEGGGGRSQKHSKSYGGSQLWSQSGH